VLKGCFFLVRKVEQPLSIICRLLLSKVAHKLFPSNYCSEIDQERLKVAQRLLKSCSMVLENLPSKIAHALDQKPAAKDRHIATISKRQMPWPICLRR